MSLYLFLMLNNFILLHRCNRHHTIKACLFRSLHTYFICKNTCLMNLQIVAYSPFVIIIQRIYLSRQSIIFFLIILLSYNLHIIWSYSWGYTKLASLTDCHFALLFWFFKLLWLQSLVSVHCTLLPFVLPLRDLSLWRCLFSFLLN